MTEKEIRDAISAAYPCRQVRIGDRVWMESPDGDLMYANIGDLENTCENPDYDPWYFETENPVLKTTHEATEEAQQGSTLVRVAAELEAQKDRISRILDEHNVPYFVRDGRIFADTMEAFSQPFEHVEDLTGYTIDELCEWLGY